MVEREKKHKVKNASNNKLRNKLKFVKVCLQNQNGKRR